MRILILNWKHPQDPAAGGAERYVTRLAEHWGAWGHDVDLLVPAPSHGTAAAVAGEERSYRVITMGTRRTIFRTARQRLLARSDDYDHVVESVSTRPFFAHEVVGHRAVILYHQAAVEVWSQEFAPPISWIGRWVVEPFWIRRMRGARVVANSASTATGLAEHGVATVAVIPPGVDAPTTTRARTLRRQPHVIFIGRLVTTKRPLDAVAAFARIRAVFHAATLDVIGGGYLTEQLRQRRDPGVTVHGCMPESFKLQELDRADLMLVPGTREGWGIVAMEAAAHGVPVAAYDIPGLRDAVVDGRTGVLTRPDPAALGDAAVGMLLDAPRWQALSTAAQARAQSFSWDRAAQALLLELQGAPTVAWETPIAAAGG